MARPTRGARGFVPPAAPTAHGPRCRSPRADTERPSPRAADGSCDLPAALRDRPIAETPRRSTTPPGSRPRPRSGHRQSRTGAPTPYPTPDHQDAHRPLETAGRAALHRTWPSDRSAERGLDFRAGQLRELGRRNRPCLTLESTNNQHLGSANPSGFWLHILYADPAVETPGDTVVTVTAWVPAGSAGCGRGRPSPGPRRSWDPGRPVAAQSGPGCPRSRCAPGGSR